jgi:hypothetical protein
MVTQIELFDFPTLNPIYFHLWSWMKREVYKRKTNCSLAFWMLLPAQCNVKINSEEKYAIFAYELQCTEVDGGIFEILL